MSKEQIEARNELADLLKDIGYDWDSYICECQENGEKPQLSYEDFHADAILEAGYRKQSENEVEVVMCKDCENAEPLESGLFRCKYHTVQSIFNSSVFNVKPTDFCSYGVRMKGGAE